MTGGAGCVWRGGDARAMHMPRSSEDTAGSTARQWRTAASQAPCFASIRR